MPERLGADKKQKIEQAHADIIAALHPRGVRFSGAEAQRLREKIAAYIGKTNPEHIDIPTMRDAIAEKITASPQGRVRWFQKAGLLHTLEEHARENTRRAAELRRSVAERTDWTPVPAETLSADGRYYLAQLLTEGHLKQESAFLEHCLGAGSLDYYLPRVRRGEIEIFSVRDARTHEPVVTIEYDVRSKSIQQVKGKNNGLLTLDSPHVKQTVELLAFLKNKSVHHDRRDARSGAPLKREVHAIADLNQLVGENSLVLATGETVEIKNLPAAELMASDVLTGNFSINPTTPADVITRVAALPVNIYAREATPEQISLLQMVSGNLNLNGTPITSLPDNLSVGGDLDLTGTNITSLPDNLSVGRSLYLYDTKITQLPDNLSVGGDLDLRHTPITSLPENLRVGGYLDLTGTNITSLPDNLTVGGDLYLSHTNITDVPPSIRSRIRGRIVGP